MELIAALAARICGAWLLSGSFIYLASAMGKDINGTKFGKFIYFLYHEIKPFYLYLLPFMILNNVMYSPSTPYWFRAVLSMMDVWYWFVLKDIDDDDRWKKRKAKLKESVKVVGSKLEVVPNHA